ncbi:MAG: hypothetical protein ACKOC6_00890, partial [bacterium]
MQPGYIFGGFAAVPGCVTAPPYTRPHAMAKVKTSFVCRDCGNVQPKWMGKCPDCGAWDALERFTERPDAADAQAPGALSLGGAGDPSD